MTKNKRIVTCQVYVAEHSAHYPYKANDSFIGISTKNGDKPKLIL